MTRISWVRRAAVLLATLAAGVAGASAGAEAVALTPATHAGAAREVARTTITFHVTTCAGCRVTLHRAIEGRPNGTWDSRTKRVQYGEVSFTVPTSRTHGLSASVRAPWEGNTGFITQVAFRYRHQAVGSKISFATARHKKRASGCWAGTDQSAVTIPLRVRKVTVLGNTGRTDGTLAWTGRTQDWWRPMLPTFDGVLGSQDIFFCDQP